ncbi:MAG: glycosyltransferase family 9 protein [Parvibaculum sp.]
MRILFITSNRLGDAVLSTGILAGLGERYPGAEFWVACGPLATPVFKHAPGVTRIIEMKKAPRAGHWRKLLAAVLPYRWDVVVDLRGSATAWLLWTKKRYILKPDHSLHRVVHNATVADFDPPPDPCVWPGEAMRARARDIVPDGMSVLAIGPAAAWRGKMWPIENFMELARRLLQPGGAMEGAHLLVTGGPADRDICQPLLDAVPEDRRIDLVGAAIDETAACFERIRLYIGNDSGLMHLAAAAGAPTVGLFGPSPEDLYRPWGEKTAFVRVPRSLEELRAGAGGEARWQRGSHMEDLQVATVEDAAIALLARTAASGDNASPPSERSPV